jgi:hypothetical protein
MHEALSSKTTTTKKEGRKGERKAEGKEKVL